MNKRCTKCGAVKSREAFSKDNRNADGLRSQCKDCVRLHRAENVEAIRERNRAYRAANIEVIKEQRRLYREANAESIREQRRAYRDANVEAIRERGREDYASNIDQYTERSRQWRATDPRRCSAHSAIAQAIRTGKLVRPSACESCGDSRYRIEAHHDDYGRPLAVRWLCAPCHQRHHAELRRLGVDPDTAESHALGGGDE